MLNFSSSNNKLQKKIIRSGDYNIECYVSLKKPSSTSLHKLYFWFKGGEVHSSVSAIGGDVLHESYTKFYKSNQIIEHGQFNYGLKKGVWKTWYQNGQLMELMEWKKGVKNGKYAFFDLNGNIIEKGLYSKGYKTGDWVNLKTKDTVNYTKGNVTVERDVFYKRWFKKKNKDSTKVKETKKEPFYKRWFKKNKKTQI